LARELVAQLISDDWIPVLRTGGAFQADRPATQRRGSKNRLIPDKFSSRGLSGGRFVLQVFWPERLGRTSWLSTGLSHRVRCLDLHPGYWTECAALAVNRIVIDVASSDSSFMTSGEVFVDGDLAQVW